MQPAIYGTLVMEVLQQARTQEAILTHQMEIIQSLIKENHLLDVSFGDPEIIYKEMPVNTGEHTLYISSISPIKQL